mmetsp:Transcript_20401/g.65235  ORF Transcript_20401/g.65235 Transcript_20401/m.65235 type:complete len:299 (+) Transcript_20401:495-1391(+)
MHERAAVPQVVHNAQHLPVAPPPAVLAQDGLLELRRGPPLAADEAHQQHVLLLHQRLRAGDASPEDADQVLHLLLRPQRDELGRRQRPHPARRVAVVALQVHAPVAELVQGRLEDLDCAIRAQPVARRAGATGPLGGGWPAAAAASGGRGAVWRAGAGPAGGERWGAGRRWCRLGDCGHWLSLLNSLHLRLCLSLCLRLPSQPLCPRHATRASLALRQRLLTNRRRRRRGCVHRGCLLHRRRTHAPHRLHLAVALRALRAFRRALTSKLFLVTTFLLLLPLLVSLVLLVVASGRARGR